MTESPPKTRLIIDTDPGVDDAHAIMMAVAHRKHGTRLEALTTVAGNVGLECTTPNACTILDELEVPPSETLIFAGSVHSLVGPNVRATVVHGTDGLGNCNFSRSARRVESEHAAIALVRLANESPGELTLAAVGPLTNLALATRLDPELPQKYKRLVVMGGNIHGRGNMPNTSEFNFYADPEAASVVFDNWPGLWLVSWETTMHHRLSSAKVEALLNAGTPRSEFFGRITNSLLGMMRKEYGEVCLHAADGLALAVALEPDIVTKSEQRRVTIEVSGNVARGHSIVDWGNDSGLLPNANIVLEVDAERFWGLMRAGVD